MSAPKRILVRAPNWLGDLVMATPGFRALRRGFPEAEIILHARAAHLPLLAPSPWFDRLVPVASYHAGAAAMLREGYALRGTRLGLGLCLPDSISSALLMRIAAPERVIGYRRPGAAWLLDDAPEPPPPMTPRERHVLGLVACALGLPPGGLEDERVELFVDEESLARAAAFRREADLQPDAPLVLMAPGASYGSSKCWPSESFAALADRLHRDGIRVALVGSPDERDLAARVVAASRAPIVNWCGRLDLPLLKAVVDGANLLVCNDAGARHIAAALGVPCIALFGPTSVAKTSLNLERVRVVVSEVACRPCYHRVCPIDHRCMRAITPDAIAEAARQTLAQPRPAEVL